MYSIGIFHPYESVRLIWDVSITIVMIYVLVDIPIQICFDVNLPTNHPWMLAEFAVDIFFMVDIMFNFNTGFFEDEKYITSRAKIAKRYVSGWFWLDLSTSIPFDRLLEQGNNLHISQISKILKIFRIIRLLKLLRLLRLMATMSKWENNDSKSSRLRLTKFLVAVLLSGHTSACFWVGIANLNRSHDHSYENYYGYDPSSWVVRFQNTWQTSEVEMYLRSLYWAFTTLSTVGYGDITPLLPVEIGFTIFIQLCGCTMFGFIVGNISSMVTQDDERLQIIKEKMSTVTAFMTFRKLPPNIVSRIKRHYEYSWKRSQVFKEEEILRELPHPIRIDCSLFIHQDIIKKVTFLSMLNDEVLPSLVSRLKPMLASSGDVVVKEGLFGNHMYVVSSGALMITLHDRFQEKAIKIEDLNSGDYFAEYAVIMDQAKHPASVIAVGYCDMFVLSHADFLLFGEEWPLELLNIIKITKTRYIQMTMKIAMKQKASRLFNLNSQGRKQGDTVMKRLSASLQRSAPLLRTKTEQRNMEIKIGVLQKLLSPTSRLFSTLTPLVYVDTMENSEAKHSTLKCSSRLIQGARRLVRRKSSVLKRQKNAVHPQELEPQKQPTTIPNTFSPSILMKILSWKNRAQLAIAVRNIEVIEKRHHDKFKIGKKEQKLLEADSNGFEHKIHECCRRQEIHNNVDVMRREFRDELCELKRIVLSISKKRDSDGGVPRSRAPGGEVCSDSLHSTVDPLGATRDSVSIVNISEKYTCQYY